MKWFVFSLLLSGSFAYEKDGDVLVLTDSDIDNAIKENEFILIEFYAPWCGHCKSLAPEYAKAATKLARLDKPVPIAKVDATENTEAATKFGVRGYPTIKWFVNGQDSEYNGGRTEAEIVSWISKKVGPPCRDLISQADVESFKDSADVVAVGFFGKSSEEFKAFETAARSSEDVIFGVVDDSHIASAFGVSVPAIVVFKNFDEGKAVHSGDFNAEKIQQFVQGNSVPLVSTFTQEGASKIFGSGIDNHFLYFSDAAADTHQGTLEQLREVAQEFRGKTLFVFVPATESRVLSYFDLTSDDVPAAVLVSLGEGDMKKYSFSKDLTAQNIREHVNSYHSGELKPTLKSEEIPEDNNGPVTVIVGKNFKDIVLDTTKDVLLEFYAPWCGHCKSLAPTWDQLGEKFSSHNSIVIAKVDATANDIDHPAVSVRGFPTILFFPANNKDTPSTYDGGRDFDSLVQYIESHATTLGDHPAGRNRDEL